MMNCFKIESILEDDKELLIKFFGCLSSKHDIKSCADRLSRAYESFKKCYNLYKEKTSSK